MWLVIIYKVNIETIVDYQSNINLHFLKPNFYIFHKQRMVCTAIFTYFLKGINLNKDCT